MLEDKKKPITTPALYEDWFLDYASYVVLERAIPALEDGLKPVQRRILHAMHTLEDGRYNKVANLIGATMQFHPHGDAAIGEAITLLGQKDLLIDPQGNWGNILTGDAAAAPRYIECRLSKFAREVAFNDKITQWTTSYDGRKKEPVRLPMKFPLLLAQGTEGIAVGLSTKILPHNFCELIEASIQVLRGESVSLYPDFATGGEVDVSEYANGKQGGKVRVRAAIEAVGKGTLRIRSLPYGVTTPQLIQSILKANEQGKIKIKKVTDNSALQAEILLTLAHQASASKTMDALYAFTLCEVTLFPSICVIRDERPAFLSVEELLAASVSRTRSLLQAELSFEQERLEEALLRVSLERLFIEHKVYRHIEACTTWEAILARIRTHLAPHLTKFHRPVREEDLAALTELKIKRISQYDIQRTEQRLQEIRTQLKVIQKHLKGLTRYTIDYFQGLLERYGAGRERKSALKKLAAIHTSDILPNDKKIYWNKKEGFVGYGLKKADYLLDCSARDRLLVFKREGTFRVVPVEEKLFVGKNLMEVVLFEKGSEVIYNMVYKDGERHHAMVKRFKIGGVVLGKDYPLARTPGSKVLHLHAQQEGDKAKCIQVQLSSQCRARKKRFVFDFSSVAVKSKQAMGNILCRFPVQKITLERTKAAAAADPPQEAPKTEGISGQHALFE